MNKQREQMNVVIVGHVDHGKSTLIGRLLADTGSLPEGKLQAVKDKCIKTSKPFEYAFLLDALKDEQSQGITIDTARCFFKSKSRDYIIIDAPGHIEFLKNMVTGASRAEAAMLVIDANEGIKENSKRHGYMMSFLGIKNITVCVNKMDLVNYDESVFNQIKEEYSEFLREINLQTNSFIPISAREGENIAKSSDKMPWYNGTSVLEAFDQFKKAVANYERELRFPVQDIYKFTEENDDRRIVSGRLESGTIKVGDEVVFLPSNKYATVATVEGFNIMDGSEAIAGQSSGITLESQIYIRPGEMLCKKSQKLPHVSNKFKANIFWMGKQPFVKDKNYKLKLASQQVPVVLVEILSVLDASELSSISNKPQIDRHDVSECILETLKPVVFDEVSHIPETGRFVIVDNYEIAGGGIILQPVFETESVISQHIKSRNFNWERSSITPGKRTQKNQHKSALVVITGEAGSGKKKLAKSIEEELFNAGRNAYYLGVSNEIIGQGASSNDKTLRKLQHIQHLGELAHVMTDAGFILVTSISDIDEYEMDMLKALNRPNKTLVFNIGENQFSTRKVDLNIEKDDDKQLVMKKIMYLLTQATVLDPEFNI